MTLVTFLQKSNAKPIEESEDNHKRIELNDTSGIGSSVIQGHFLQYNFLHQQRLDWSQNQMSLLLF